MPLSDYEVDVIEPLAVVRSLKRKGYIAYGNGKGSITTDAPINIVNLCEKMVQDSQFSEIKPSEIRPKKRKSATKKSEPVKSSKIPRDRTKPKLVKDGFRPRSFPFGEGEVRTYETETHHVFEFRREK